MKITKGIVVALALLAGATSVTGQQARFQIGIAQPAAGFPPTQAPATVVRGGTFAGNAGFTNAPIGPFMAPGQPFMFPGQQFVFPGQPFVVPGQPFVHGQQFVVPGQPFVVPGQQFVFPGQPFVVANQVVTPNPAFLPNQPVLTPGQVLIPQPVFTPAAIVVPAVQVPSAHFGPPVHPRPFEPPIGTPRAVVIQQLGYPTVSVITSRGEILQFTGGATVVIQNGQVVRSR